MLKKTVLIAAFLLATGVSQATIIPGTRMDVDWPALISGQDIILTKPPQEIKYGLLLGNGDIGVSVFGAPECIKLSICKSDIWDYRDSIYEGVKNNPPLTQKQFLDAYTRSFVTKEEPDAWKEVTGPWSALTSKTPHAPKIAGQVRIRNGSLAGAAYVQRLHLHDAEVTGDMGDASIRTLVHYPTNVIAVRYTPGKTAEFDVELYKGKIPQFPDGCLPAFGAQGRDMWLTYRFPVDSKTYAHFEGFGYAMYARVVGAEAHSEARSDQAVARVRSAGPVLLLVSAATTREVANPLAEAKRLVDEAERAGFEKIVKKHREHWHKFWRRSLVELQKNQFMTRNWFFCNYAVECSSRPGKVAPGLFGVWQSSDGPGWWGCYTCDYNFQQNFMGAFSSNHLEQVVPYAEAVHSWLPAAIEDSKTVYGIDGAMYFCSAYPDMQHNPHYGTQYSRVMALSAWMMQELWWYYQYSQDKEFLKKTAYPVMRECAKLYEGYLTEAADGKYDMEFTYSPEHWFGKNCVLDLACIKYLMKAAVEASTILGVDADRRKVWQHIAGNLREYPTGDAPIGKVLLDKEGQSPTYSTYNVPVPLTAVFPGNDIGLHSPEPLQDIARRTVRHMRLNLLNQYVLVPMARVRLGEDVIDDFETYTRALRRYNGSTYLDTLLWDVWEENFGSTIVINESLVQSYTGDIRINPVKLDQPARFATLRTVGAFLVSSEIRPDGYIPYVAITSEAGRQCKLIRPWDGEVRVREASSMKPVAFKEKEGALLFDTKKGVTYIVDRPDDPWEKMPITRIAADEPDPEPVQWDVIYTGGEGMYMYALKPYSFDYRPGVGIITSTIAGNTTWQILVGPIDTSRYSKLEVVSSGSPNASISVDCKDAGGESLAKLDYKRASDNYITHTLALPPARFAGAIAVNTKSEDKKRAENRLRSIRFLAQDGSAIDVDLSAIDPQKGLRLWEIPERKKI
ncbi:MAG: glycoside hydrolase N-terminal domain-containing protein [Armatimonadetes bacterium]|nr:glycoside hydrolase N-terminal domain-containing protein [Armatimonadota bacterium]